MGFVVLKSICHLFSKKIIIYELGRSTLAYDHMLTDVQHCSEAKEDGVVDDFSKLMSKKEFEKVVPLNGTPL